MERSVRTLLVVVSTILALTATARGQQPARSPEQPSRPRILAFYTVGGELDHVLFGQQAARALAAGQGSGGYAFTATTDWDALNDDNLRDTRVVVWLNDSPHTPAQREAFERYVDRGGAWLGFHAAGFGSNAWPWFTGFMGGGRFAASNWPSLPARLNVDDPSHPIVAGTPATFVAPINEWYAWAPSPRANAAVKVLMTLDASNFPLGIKNTLNGGDIPVAWTNTRYRMVYLNFGHGDRIFSTSVLPAIIDNSLRFLLTGPASMATPAATESESAAAQVERALRERLDAYGRGDAEAWGRFVADDCVCGHSNKAGLQAEMRGRPAGVRIGASDIGEVEVRVQGDAAAVRYRMTETTTIGAQQVGVPLIKAETFVRRDGRWLLLGGAETVQPVDPPAVAIDPARFDALVGRYEYGPGVVDVVTRDGDRLMVQATGSPAEELFPETATTFFLKGQPWRYAFDLEGGRAVSLRFRMFGRELAARRVDSPSLAPSTPR